LVLGHLGEQAQHTEPDQEAIRRLSGTEPERRPERIALRIRQVTEPVEQRRAQLMQAGERQLHLMLHAGRAHDAACRCPREQVVEQGGLADARLSPEHQHAALASPHTLQEPLQRLALAAPATQSRPGITLTHGCCRAYATATGDATGDSP
jgi:hypothetical protein